MTGDHGPRSDGLGTEGLGDDSDPRRVGRSRPVETKVLEGPCKDWRSGQTSMEVKGGRGPRRSPGGTGVDRKGRVSPGRRWDSGAPVKGGSVRWLR